MFGALFVVHNITTGLKRHGSFAFVLNPLIWFSLFFALIHIVTPVIKYERAQYRYANEYQALSHVALLIVLLLTLIVISIVTKRLVSHEIWRRKRVRGSMNSEVDSVRCRGRLLYFSYFILGLGVYGLIDHVTNSNGGGIYSGRAQIVAGTGFERLLPSFITSALFLLAYLRLSQTEIRWKRILQNLGIIVALIASIYFSLINNSRNSILFLVIVLVSMYAVYKPFKFDFSRRTILLGLASTLLLVGLVNVLYSLAVIRYSINDSAYILERRDNIVFYSIDGAFGNDENLLWLIENDSERFYGMTYLAAILNVIPRKIWPDKPLGAGPRLKNEIYPGSYVVGSAGNSSLTTGLFTEAFQNFGWAGFVVAIFIWYWLVKTCLRNILSNYLSIRGLPWIVIMVSCSSMLLYSEFLGLFTRVAFITAPLFFAAFILKIRSAS